MFKIVHIFVQRLDKPINLTKCGKRSKVYSSYSCEMDALVGWYIFAKGEPLRSPESKCSDCMDRGPLSLVRTPCVAVETIQIYLRNRRLVKINRRFLINMH